MNLTRVALKDFRNYARAELIPCAGVTVLYGQNAQGKTALLEAVYLCCTGRSHRTSRDKELIRWGQPLAEVSLETMQGDGSHQVEIRIPNNDRKSVKVNGRGVTRSGELMGHITGVLFSPEDLRMVKGSPGDRRRFIDMELAQIRPSYYYELQRYARALAQRGCLLRAGEARGLEVWDELLAASGARIVLARRAFIEKLETFAARTHRDLSGGKEALTLVYRCPGDADGDEAALTDFLARALFAARERDIQRGVTSVGPHHDDLLIQIDGMDARAYGSQGQQRSCALSMKLAELRVMEAESGECPILMLDDVMSELDPDRRRQLLGAMEGVQTLVTCTDPDDLAGAKAGLMQKVEAGALVPPAFP